MLTATPGPCRDCAAGRFVVADDLVVAGFEAGFLELERAALDVPFERVEVPVFRAEEEVPRDAMGSTLTHGAPSTYPPRRRIRR